MKQKSIIAILLLFLILITGCSSKNKVTQGTINDSNIYNGGIYQRLDSVSIKAPFYSVGAGLGGLYKTSNITKESFPYKEDEEFDDKGKLLNNKMYIEIQNCIKNETDKTIEINLQEFYLVICDGIGNIKRGSTDNRYAYLKDKDSKAVLKDFTLTLKPFEETDVITMYVEDLDNVLNTSNCFYRVKCNNEVAYYNISTSSSPNPDY